MSWSPRSANHRFYNTDALIVQDMGILESGISRRLSFTPVHCVIFAAWKKAKFLADVGFSQIVPARELNLSQIAAIHQATDATTEFFHSWRAVCRLILGSVISLMRKPGAAPIGRLFAKPVAYRIRAKRRSGAATLRKTFAIDER